MSLGPVCCPRTQILREGFHGLQALAGGILSRMSSRAYDALLLDLDGTLVTSQETIHPHTRRALDEVRARGLRVMIVTGRSVISARPVLEDLKLTDPAAVFNGAAVWSPSEGRLIEERVLSSRTLARLHDYRRESGDMAVLMSANRKVVRSPRSDDEVAALQGLQAVEYRDEAALCAEEYVLRVTFMSKRETDSATYAKQIEEHVGQPAYLTHFPLALLPRHRASKYLAVDVHAPCRGKAEALRYLHDVEGIPPERVVAVGDAFNDEPMLTAAGLGVAMGNAVPSLQALADRSIGHHDSGAIGDLIEELFLS